MIAMKLKNFLDERHVRYVTVSHSPAFTTQEVAESAHISGKSMAKTVMVVADGVMAMTVVPANQKLTIDELCEFLETDDVRLAREEEFKNLFPDCEPGAMPPFGNLYDMPVYVSPDLAEEAEIAFNAGTHADVVRMGFHDFERLVVPQVARMSH